MREAYWELHVRGGTAPRSPVVLGRKHCAGCGRWRHVCDFGVIRGRFRARCRACHRAYMRLWTANRTPEQREARREYERFLTEGKRRQAGIPVTRRKLPSVVDRPEYVFLEPGPLLGAIKGWEDLDLAKVTGIPARTIFRYRVGESRHVRLDIADRLALAVGTHLWDLYGDAPLIHIHDAEMAA
jgi:hypothetical protein